MVDTFAEELHPRGADGRFIEKFGIIKFLKNAKWTYGKVSGITKDEHGNIKVSVDESDLSGKITGKTHTLAPNQVYSAPKPTSYLKTADPQAKKIGGQAGSNPGGMYELPESKPDQATTTQFGEPVPPWAADFIPTPQFFRLTRLKNSDGTYELYAQNEDDGWWHQIISGKPSMSANNTMSDSMIKNWDTQGWLSAEHATLQPVAPKSNKWYVKKAKSKQHGRNEDLANALYRALGVPVPDVAYDEKDGQIYSKIVDGSVEDMAARLKGQSAADVEWRHKIRQNFAIDAWLGNWDVFGMTWDNVKTAPDGVPYRIDNGGALLYRAQGAAKGKDFGPDVPELDSFKTGKKSQIFGGISKEEELDGAQRILAMRPEDIWLMVAQHQLPDSLGDTLIARRAYIAKYYGLDLPEDVEVKPVDTVDLTVSGGKSRDWKNAPLSSLLGILSTGDTVEIDGEQHIVGMGVPGVPVGSAAKAIQMSGWLGTHGADKQVHFTKGKSEKPRVDHGAQMEMSAMVGHAWERGDKITFFDDGTEMEVIEVNDQIGVALLKPAGTDKPPVLWSLRYDGDKTITVDTWDKKVPEPEPGIESQDQTYIDPWSGQELTITKVTPPEEAAAPVLTEPEPPAVQAEPEAATPSSPFDIWITNPPTKAAAAQAAIKADIDKDKQDKKTAQASKGTKAMTLGDGTEADVGAKVFSSKDGKTYLYVKKKGQFAVVTDPDSDDPTKTLMKLASTLGQPDKTPTANPAAGGTSKPLTANGVEPKVGMTATAKDGHTGVITMVSPDGKFVFITDSTGKKKRKSTSTVTIDSQDAPAAAVTTPEPVVSTNEAGQTTISIPDPEPVENVEEVKALNPVAASWWPKSEITAQGTDWAAKVEPDGSYGMVPVGSGEGIGTEGYILTSTGQVAGFDIKTGALPVDPKVAQQAALKLPDGLQYKALVNGKWYAVIPTAMYGNDLVLVDNEDNFMVVTYDSGKVPLQLTYQDIFPITTPDEIPNVVTVNPPDAYEDFKQLGDLKLKKGDLISPDGNTWLEVDKQFDGFVRCRNNDGEIVYLSSGAGTSVLHSPGTPVVKKVDITTEPMGISDDQKKIDDLLAVIKQNDPASISDAVSTVAAGVAEGQFVTFPGPGGVLISGMVTKVEIIPDAGYTPITLHTAEGTMSFTFPNGAPVVIHGVFEEGAAPVPLSPKQWAGIGVHEGQYVYPSSHEKGAGIAHKVLGFGPDGVLQLQNGETGVVFSFMTLENMQGIDGVYFHISNNAPSNGYYPPVGEKEPPKINTQSHDAMSTKTYKTVWDSLPDTVTKPTNTTVYYDEEDNEFIWLNGAGQMVVLDPVTGKQDAGKNVLSESQWIAYKEGAIPIIEPEHTVVNHPTLTSLKFEVIPDHFMVLDSDAVWAVPKGQMNHPDQWVMAMPVGPDGKSDLAPGILGPSADTSGATVLVNPDDPPEIDPPQVSTTEPKVPDHWPSKATQAAEKYPGKKLLFDIDTNSVYVENTSGEWQYMFANGLLGIASEEWELSGNTEVWNPEAAVSPTITVHGKQYGDEALIYQKEGSQVYYIKPDPYYEWHLLFSDGTILPAESEDLDPKTGDPVGTLIWPQGFEQEKPPVDTHILGGESTNFSGMSTEKDSVVLGLNALGEAADAPGVVWVKAVPGTGTGYAYYGINTNSATVSTWFVNPGEQPYLNDESAINFDTAEEAFQHIKQYLSPNYVFTDVTPDGFQEPTPDAPAKEWDQLVVDTINPASLGYGGLKWVDPALLKNEPTPDGWEDEQWSLMLDYCTVIGPNKKMIKVKANEGGTTITKMFLVSASGGISPQTGGGALISAGEIDQNKYDPVNALKQSLIDAGFSDVELEDVSPVNPVNQIIGYKHGEPKTPGNQWYVNISPSWQVFKGQSSSASSDDLYYYRDDDGKWWEVSPSGTIQWAEDDESAVNDFKKYGVSLKQLTQSTDQPIADKAPVNVPGPTNKATGNVTYSLPNGTEIKLSAGDELFVHPEGTVHVWKTASGQWWYKDTGADQGQMWPEGIGDPGDFYIAGITPVDIGTSMPQPSAPTSPPVPSSAQTAPPGVPGDPGAILSGPPTALTSIDAELLKASGTWLAYKNADGEIAWLMTTGEVSSWTGNPEAQYWTQNINGEWTLTDKYHLSPSSYPAVWLASGPPAGIPEKESTPAIPTPSVPVSTAPSAPTYPGSSKPTPEEVQSWGGALTKDGYIPTSGMMVKGKGPMHGTVLSVSKDKTKAVVLTDDGKKTTRLIEAITVDHSANYTKYATVVLPDAPPGQYLQVKSMQEGIDHLLNQPGGPQLGQMIGIMVGGTQDSTVHMRVATGPDGKPVIRVYTRLERSQAKNLAGLLTTPTAPEPGAWVGNAKPSGDIVPGDEIAMRFGSTHSKWKPDPDGENPTHKVTKVAPAVNGVVVVTLENKTTGEVVTSNFHVGEGKTVFTYTWDANKMPTVKPGATVTAPGWTKKPGRQVSGIAVDGSWHPDKQGLLNSNYGSSGAETYIYKGADGTVIEATVPTVNKIRSTDGFTAITVPAGDNGEETAKRLSAAITQLGISGNPPNQSELKAKVAQHLRQFIKLDETTLGKQVDAKDTEAVAQQAFKDFGKIVDIPDIGWHDVMIGQDGGGTSQFYWSDRVIAAIEAKQKNKVLVKANNTATADRLVSFLMRGVLPGAVRVTENAANNTSAVSDDNNQATHGGYFSAIRDDKFPLGNPFWSNGSSTIYVNPMAALIRIGDMRANEHDVFGFPVPSQGSKCPAPCGQSAKKMIDGTKHQKQSGGFNGLMDVMPAGGAAPEDIMFIGADSQAEIAKAIKKLKDAGITHWGGRPVEEIIRLRSDIVKMKPSEVGHVVKRPDNAIPILSVPVVVGGPPEATAPVVAASEELAA